MTSALGDLTVLNSTGSGDKGVLVQQKPSYFAQGREVVVYAADKVSKLYDNASVPGEPQKVVQAGIRSTIGITSIYFYPGTAIVSAVVGGAKPDLVVKGCQIADGAITGFWKTLPFQAKIILPVVGVAAVASYDPTALFKLAGIVFSAKLGAELGVRNYRKENVAAITLQAEIDNPVDE